MKTTTAAKVKRNNARFAKMTAAQKRVRIAKDVIDQLDAKRLIATTGVYVGPRNDTWYLIRKADNSKELNKQLPAQCKVCGIGAMFVAAVDRFDRLKLGDALSPMREWGGKVGGSGRPDEYLSRFFSSAQVDLVEQAFEVDRFFCFDDPTEPAELFGAKHKRPSDRLRAIMRNIIRNKGTFKP